MKRAVEAIMQRDVVTQQISGVPVVTEDGEILGVVSATDVVRLAAGEAEVPGGDLSWEPLALLAEEDEEEGARSYFGGSEDWHYPKDEQAKAMPEGLIAGFTVSDIMTPAVFTVLPQDTVESVAKFLLRGRIHRALVVEDEQLKGIVTTFDLLTALVETDG